MLVLLLCLGLSRSAFSGLVKYDQTQTGDYNVHLDLKNIEILAFLDDTPSNAEYDYDYGELTLKPPALPQNVSTTEKPWTSLSTSEEPNSGGNSTASSASSTSTTAEPTTTKTHRRCGAGFYRDPNGRCRRLRKPIKLGGLLQHAKSKIAG